MTGQGRLILGTSGFSYRHWRDGFYAGVPSSRWLESYAERFCAVELNVSFYRLPAPQTFRGWAERTPPAFEFAVKGSRAVTHYRRLQDTDDAVTRLFSAAAELGDKASCFLWQMPPKAAPDLGVLRRFCEALPHLRRAAGLPEGVRHAFEFRDSAWFEPEVLAVLREHGCALVMADPGVSGQVAEVTTPFTYLRFHHGPRPSGAYLSAELERHAERTADLLSGGTDVFAYFNNDGGGWAPRNAMEFADKVAERTGSEPLATR